jgi:alcohol dehydrogenase
MRAVMFDQFRQLPQVVDVDDPACPDDGVVVRVAATGLCRSDWHGCRTCLGTSSPARSRRSVPP